MMHELVATIAAEALLVVIVWLHARVILVTLLAVVLVVELLSIPRGLVLDPLAVNEVGTFGLGETVDLSASEADEKLLGELVGDRLA